MNQEVRVRFAPSPTGFLHVGGARTALFNWLYAKSQGGKFLLRIEDTDRERSEQRFTDDILESLRWLGMEPDEEPLFQSARMERHKEVVNELLAKGLAYKCDVSQEELDRHRELAKKEKRAYRYPGICRDKDPSEIKEPYVVRIKNPLDGETVFDDLIRGKISISNKEIDDWVILRQDGSPTYNFVVTVDDHDQRCTHILRGEDHINNTPKQMLLAQALGWESPKFGHLPMIFGSDRAKLSKRHGAASTLEYRLMGYLPAALINFLVRLGWSHGDEEVFEIDQLKKVFSLDTIGKSGAIFSQEKLDWVSGHHMRSTSSDVMIDYLAKYFSKQMAFAEGVAPERLKQAVELIQPKTKTVLELIDQLEVLFGPDVPFEPATLKEKQFVGFAKVLPAILPQLESVEFTKDVIEATIRSFVEASGEKFGVVAQGVRYGVTAGRLSPELFDMLELQGKEMVLRRIKAAIESFDQHSK